jgi:putative restriction endonuclease
MTTGNLFEANNDVAASNPLLTLNVWTRGTREALNKPLLILLALGYLSRGERSVPFSQIEEKLKKLLREFGNVGKPRAHYSFWRLKEDKLWVVTPSDLVTNSSGDVSTSQLREKGAVGRFSDSVLEWLTSEKGRLTTATHEFLAEYFAESLHEDLLVAVDFRPTGPAYTRRKRDTTFRALVLQAYQLKCAVCRQDIRIGSESVCLEAAHIKWHQAGGPDEVNNGLSLCSTHHKLFDRGAFTINENLRILVSEHMTGSTQLEEVILRFHTKSIEATTRIEYKPAEAHLRWHRDKIFKERPRTE